MVDLSELDKFDTSADVIVTDERKPSYIDTLANEVHIHTALRHGMFRFDDTRVDRFVFIPKGFNYTTNQGLKEILAAVGLAPPDLVFRFPTSDRIVPTKAEEDADPAEAFRRALRNSAFDPATASPPPFSDSSSRESRVKNFVYGLADSCKQSSHAIFLLTKPDLGNAIAELACNAADRHSIPSLGLFDSTRFTFLSRKVDDDDDDNDDEAKEGTTGKDATTNNEEKEYRKLIYSEIFLDGKFVPTTGDNIRQVIRVSGTRMKSEENDSDGGLSMLVPNGLAGRCSHRLVFPTSKECTNFERFLADKLTTGLIVVGSEQSTLHMSLASLQKNQPLFILQDTGKVSNTIAELIQLCKRWKRMRQNGELDDKDETNWINDTANLHFFVGDKDVHDNNSDRKSDGDDEEKEEYKTPDDEHEDETHASTENEANKNDSRRHEVDNIEKQTQTVFRSIRSFVPNFNPAANFVVDVSGRVDMKDVQDRISQIMSSYRDVLPELNGVQKDSDALLYTKKLEETLLESAHWYWMMSFVLQTLIRTTIFLTTLLTIYQATECTTTANPAPSATPTDEAETGTDLCTSLRICNTIIPLVASALIAIDSILSPATKNASLLLASKRIEGEWFKFLTRTGEYRHQVFRRYNVEHKRPREKFTKKCEAIYEECIASSMSDGNLFSAFVGRETVKNSLGVSGSVVERQHPSLGSIWNRFAACCYWKSDNVSDKGNSNSRDMYDDVFMNTSVYVEKRVKDKISEFIAEVPRYSLARFCFRFSIVGFTATSAVLASSGRERWVPVALAVTALFEFAISYLQVDERVQEGNKAALKLQNLHGDWIGLGLMENRLSSNKSYLVETSEDAILAFYEHYARTRVERDEELKEADEDAGEAAGLTALPTS